MYAERAISLPEDDFPRLDTWTAGERKCACHAQAVREYITFCFSPLQSKVAFLPKVQLPEHSCRYFSVDQSINLNLETLDMATRTVGDFPIKGKIVAITGGGSGIVFSYIASICSAGLFYNHLLSKADMTTAPCQLRWQVARRDGDSSVCLS